MFNPILQALGNPGGARPQPNPMMNNQNPFAMIQQFNQFRQQMNGKNPQQMVEQLMQSGQMSPAQLEQLKSQAQIMMSMLGK